MPPEIYDGPLWAEALGGLAFLGGLIALLTIRRRPRTRRLSDEDIRRGSRHGR